MAIPLSSLKRQDTVRVLRIIEYVGPRYRVEEVVSQSIHGTKHAGNGLTIRGATIGAYPDILENSADVPSKDVDDDRSSEDAFETHKHASRGG